MAAEEKWYFTKEQLANAPSRRYAYDADKELSCRQQAANFIQDMGQRLQVTQLCINTAIVYMHRFYMFHSFSRFHRNAMAAAALFLAAKVEEQPRKLEHVIKVAQICLHRDVAPPDVKSEAYMEQAQELVVNENILLQTLGFDVAIDHPHTHVVRCCHLVRASKDLAQTSYFMASNSLHLTTMCLQYKPTVVACFCIHLACKWSNWEIPQSNEGKPWFWYIDKTVSQELLEQLTEEFLAIFEKCPSRLKKKIVSLSQNQNPTILSQFSSNKDDKKRNGEGSVLGANVPSASDDMKKKQEYQRHHPDYKKHHLSHHSRSDPLGVGSKSSCMFGPPQRTQPSSHNSNHPSRSIPKPTVTPDVSNIGKPEHLHHRPRRPDEKIPRNHEHIPPPYKKFENKVPSGVVNEFPQTASSNPSSRSSVNFTGMTTPTSYQIGQPPPQMSATMSMPNIPEPMNAKETLPPIPVVPKLVTPLPQKTKIPSPPPTIKVERSIFSPEKCTPPPEPIKPLIPSTPPLANANYIKTTPTIKEEFVVLKQEPIPPPEIKQEISSPKEEKPPDFLIAPIIEEPISIQVETDSTVETISQPLIPVEEQYSHKELKKKKKKHRDHKEHKEKHKDHKDKHKHKHKNRDPEPIVITIPKEKLTLPPPEHGLKIKIARDKITTPISPVESPSLKIKISQGKIKESRKRERSEERTSPDLPSKYHRPNGTTSLQVNNKVDILECSLVDKELISSPNLEVNSSASILTDDSGTCLEDSFTFKASPLMDIETGLTRSDQLEKEVEEPPVVETQNDINHFVNNKLDKGGSNSDRGGAKFFRGNQDGYNYKRNDWNNRYTYYKPNVYFRGNRRGRIRGGYRGAVRGGYPENKSWPPRPPMNYPRGPYNMPPPIPQPMNHLQHYYPHPIMPPHNPHNIPPQFFNPQQTTYLVQYPPAPPLPDEPPPEIPPPPPPE